jgi:hypothetical protein
MENCFFYISWMYEFLHRLGHLRPMRSKPREQVCPLLPESDHRRPKCDPSLCAKCILLILGPDHLPDPQGDGAQGQSHEREPTEGDHGVEYFAKLDANEGTRIWAPLIELAA